MQLAEEDELMWDDGSATPEPCLDEFDLVTKVALPLPWPPPLTQMRLTRHPDETSPIAWSCTCVRNALAVLMARVL